MLRFFKKVVTKSLNILYVFNFFMGLTDFFKKKKERNENSNNLTEENRLLGLEKRRQNRQMKDLEFQRMKILEETQILKAQVDLEKAQLDLEIAKEERLMEDDDEQMELSPELMQNPDVALMSMLMQVLNIMQVLNKPAQNGGVSNPIAPSTSAVSPPPPPIIKPQPTDEELKNMKTELPDIYLKQAKTAEEEDLRKIISSNFPEWNEETTLKAIKILRE